MKKAITIILYVFFVKLSMAQNCFEAYDAMFENGADTMNYEQFHKRELAFLESLNGCTPPDFSVVSLSGNELILSALIGKVVVLNFWFTTCLPCLKEIPHLNNLTQNYDADEVIFIAFARDNEEKLNAFFKRFGSFDYQIIPESHKIATEYKVIGWPQSMVINKQGKVHQSWAGVHGSAEALAKEIDSAILDCLSNY